LETVKKYLTLLKEKAAPIFTTVKEALPWLFTRKAAMIAGTTVALLLLGIGVKHFFFSGDKNKNDSGAMVQVKVKKIKRQDFTDSYTVMGSIKGAIENELRFEIDGVIASYNYKEGDRITKGKIICSLDPKDAFTKTDFARSKYHSEQSTYYSASQRLKVYEDLFRMKAISESKLHETRFEIEAAEARMKAALSELELAQSNLAKTNLLAPSDGMLAEILIKPGDYITPQDVVAKFISGGSTNFEVDVPEKDVNKLKVGMKSKINCDSFPGRDFMGSLIEIAPTVKERTRTTTVKVEMENKDGVLRSGMFGRGTIFLTELKDVIIVPSDSVVSLGDTTYLVPIVKADLHTPGEGTIEMRHVKIGQKLSQATIIEDGLFPDEQVVTETQGQLSDGLRVHFSEEVEEQMGNIGE
jgi:membrane fusion protein (multidrug efflux system)